MAIERKKEGQTSAAGPPKDVTPSKKPADAKRPSEAEESAKAGKGGAGPRQARKRQPAKAAAEAKGDRPEKAPARKKPSEPARPRRRSREQPVERTKPAPARPVVHARAKYVRSSARKARLVIDHIRGKSIDEARAVLRHTPRAVARDVQKLLESAVANAENNHELVGDDLVIKEIYADEGPTIKRFRPRALGRATRIRKRTSHLTLTLTPKE